MPPIFSGEMGSIAHQWSGQVILIGIGVCVIGIIFSGLAGLAKQKELSDQEKKASVKEFQYGRGIAVSILSGVMSACFAYGLAAGKPIADITRAELLNHGGAALWQNLSVLVVVLWGGFTTNLLWCLVLMIRNRSANQFSGTPGPVTDPLEDRAHVSVTRGRLAAKLLFSNYSLAALAGVIWYFQFFFYSMGETEMGQYAFSSWTLHMASIIIFATILGFALKEWRGTSVRAHSMVGIGLAFLVASTIVVGYGNYIKANEGSGQVSISSQPALVHH
jgi:L-rhamnose-H+ transport protein